MKFAAAAGLCRWKPLHALARSSQNILWLQVSVGDSDAVALGNSCTKSKYMSFVLPSVLELADVAHDSVGSDQKNRATTWSKAQFDGMTDTPKRSSFEYRKQIKLKWPSLCNSSPRKGSSLA